MNWQPIETAPKDGTELLLYWPSYNSAIDDKKGPEVISVGRWKTNSRLQPNYSDGTPKSDAKAISESGLSESYFSDSWEADDYGLAKPENAPTYWMPRPDPPTP